jgi:integrase/recombinase XerD
MKRGAVPAISEPARQALERYRQALYELEDLRPATVRNYLSDLRHFIAWCEATWQKGREDTIAFAPTLLTTPLLVQYRSYLQTVLRLRPASVNRILISLKRYCSWATEAGTLPRDPARAVKLVERVSPPPRQLTDQEEQAFIAAASTNPHDLTILTLLLHTGLRAHELCALRIDQVHLGKRSGTIEVLGKRNKHREVPLNVTARQALAAYLPTRPPGAIPLFPSGPRGRFMSERTLGRLVQKYGRLARVEAVSPHDLRHRFGYRMAESVPLHRLAQLMGHDSLDTTLLYTHGTKRDLQRDVETIAWA